MDASLVARAEQTACAIATALKNGLRHSPTTTPGHPLRLERWDTHIA